MAIFIPSLIRTVFTRLDSIKRDKNTSAYRNQSEAAASKQTYLKVFKLMHFSAIAVINETVTAHPLIFIVKTNEDIRSIRAKVLSVSFKPRKSASLQSEWSYAIRRHFLHTMATCPRSLKPHQWKISSKIDSGSFSIIFAAILVCDAFRAIWSIKPRTLKFAHTHN